MRKLFYGLLLAAPGWASLTTVSQSVKAPDGTPASGMVYIRITSACHSGRDFIGDKTLAVRFADGAFAVRLVPNDTCAPTGTSYSVSWQLAGGKSWSEAWVVPTSATPVTVDAVRVAAPPVPSVKVRLAQVDLGAVDPTKTYCLQAAAGTTQAAECSGGGSTAGHTWDDLRTTTWDSLR
jgi:hypothetical protein